MCLIVFRNGPLEVFHATQSFVFFYHCIYDDVILLTVQREATCRHSLLQFQCSVMTLYMLCM